MKTIRARLPVRAKDLVRAGVQAVMGAVYAGRARYCPICEGSSRRFLPFGVVLREDAQCPRCLALERHRLLWLFLSRRTDLFDGRPKRVLHVAPEFAFAPRLRKRLGESYLTADLENPRAMVKMDITRIQFPDESFDVILCSHVLEHVSDDRQAMRELRRVLRSSGWAILLVPIFGERTFEDPSIVDPRERLKAFHQEDHVRLYGPDYVDRLRDEGFEVEVVGIGDVADAGEVTRMGLTPVAGDIYYCTRRA
jgi:SAM-dependent methyltransferase